MIASPETVSAYGLIAVTAGLICGYALVLQPLGLVLPFKVQAAVRAWVSSVVQSAFKLFVNRAFEIELLGDAIDPQESALVILNHSSSIDYPLVTTLAAEHGVGNNYFFFAHRRLVKLPTLPVLWSIWRGNGNWTAPRRALGDVFRDVPRTGPQTAPKWVVMFPEVHEFDPVTHRQHQLLCCAAGAPLLKHLLYPRYPAFVQAVEHFYESNVATIYDLTVQYQNAAHPLRTEVPTWRDFILSHHDWKVTITVKRRPLSAVGGKPGAIQKWLEKTWYRKDGLLEKREKKAK